MRTKVTLALVFLNVALFFYIFQFEHSWRVEAGALELRRRVLSPERTAAITQLEVTGPGLGYTLVRQREQWSLSQPLAWPANPAAVSSILSELQLLEHEVSFPTAELGRNNNPTLADYGLEKPRVTIAFRSGGPDGPRTELRLGDTTKGNRLYVLSPEGDRVHVVPRSLADRVALTPEQLRADQLLTIPVFEARSLGVQVGAAGTGPVLRIRIRRDRDRWQFETPIIARAGKVAVDTTISQLNALQARTFPPAPPAVLPSAAPTLRIALEGNNRNETLFLGEPLPAPAGRTGPEAGGDGTVEYFAQLEGRAPVFTVAVRRDLLETLRQAQERLREKRLLDFDPRSVTAITLASPLAGQPPLTLQRLDAGAPGASPDGAWQVARRTGDGATTEALPADPQLVQQLLTQLSLLSAVKFESDAPTSADLETWGFNRPEREVTLTFAALPGASGAATPLVLRLGSGGRRDAATPRRDILYARVGSPSEPGLSISSVDAGILRDLRNDPAAWRVRTVQEWPANSRLTRLRLVELGTTEQVRAEAAWDPAGQPTGPVPSEAVSRLAALLGRVQAARLVATSFREEGSTPGGEPWRYRLEATAGPAASPDGAPVTRTLFFTRRLGGAQQLGGAREAGLVFELEQAWIDALWPLTDGRQDPGAPAPLPPR